MKVRIDDERCSGHGRCYALSPEVFDCDDEGRGVVRSAEVDSDELIEAARRAADNCPELAIELD